MQLLLKQASNSKLFHSIEIAWPRAKRDAIQKLKYLLVISQSRGASLGCSRRRRHQVFSLCKLGDARISARTRRNVDQNKRRSERHRRPNVYACQLSFLIFIEKGTQLISYRLLFLLDIRLKSRRIRVRLRSVAKLLKLWRVFRQYVSHLTDLLFVQLERIANSVDERLERLRGRLPRLLPGASSGNERYCERDGQRRTERETNLSAHLEYSFV